MQNKRKRNDHVISRKFNSEKHIVEQLLGNFIAEGSKGERLIEDICKIPIKQIRLIDLIELSKIISNLTNIHFARNFKRKKELIIKWFNDNYDEIKKISPSIICTFENEL